MIMKRTPATKCRNAVPATKWRTEFPATKWRRVQTATKWRHAVAMGVSPWKLKPQRPHSPEGTTGTPAQPIPVAPSGLWDLAGSLNHGFAPVATTCRPAGTNVLTPGRYVGAEEVEDEGVSATKWQTEFPATKWRHAVAMGVSPWNRKQTRAGSPEGTTGTTGTTGTKTQPIHAAPSGLWDLAGSRNHGFAPMATTCRPAGTNVLTPGRYVGAEEVEDDGVPFAEKMEGLTRELATQFHESERLQSAIRNNQCPEYRSAA
ncbi:MAG: hypothetical protein ABJZ55_15855 [Fuerstiella sp.]